MIKTVLPLILAALLAVPAYAFDSGDPFGMGNVQADKPAKAQREVNDGHWLETQAKGFAAGAGAGVVSGTVMGAAALNPLVAVPIIVVIADRVGKNKNARVNAFYSGTVVRGRIIKVEHAQTMNNFGWWAGFYKSSVKVIPMDYFGFDLGSFPSNEFIRNAYDVIHLDVDGPDGATSFALVRKYEGYTVGDVVDVKSPVGVFALNTQLLDNLKYDFNKHMPRVVNVYCKYDNPACQNDYESSLGVITRHTDTEFPPSQYLIDPAIITADQAKAKKENDESKTTSSTGGFSMM